MKLPLAIASVFLILTCASCYRYQYATVTGDLRKNEQHQLFFESDSVKVQYTFMGADCPIQIQVANKLNTPLYVDWKKSAVIFEGLRFPYWDDKSTLNATIKGYDLAWTNQVSTSDAEARGTLYRNEQISFIPPNSSVIVEPITVRKSFFQLPQPGKDQRVVLNETGMKGFKYSFPKETTPLQFRSYLTISYTEDFKHPIVLDNQFWVSEVIQTSLEPYSWPNKDSDQFYLREDTGFGTFMLVLIASGILIGLVFK